MTENEIVDCAACTATAARFGQTFQHGPCGPHELFMAYTDRGELVAELRQYGNSGSTVDLARAAADYIESWRPTEGSGTERDPWPLPPPGVPVAESGWYGSRWPGLGEPPKTITVTFDTFDVADDLHHDRP